MASAHDSAWTLEPKGDWKGIEKVACHLRYEDPNDPCRVVALYQRMDPQVGWKGSLRKVSEMLITTRAPRVPSTVAFYIVILSATEFAVTEEELRQERDSLPKEMGSFEIGIILVGRAALVRLMRVMEVPHW